MADHQDFIYLSTVQQLADWTPESASLHSQNISNTPLVPRPTPKSHNRLLNPRNTIPNFLVCHDFKGGYHPSEAAQGQSPFEQIIYTTEYLQYFSSFVYFTHRRVTIPPAPWINLMHRNGVKILGTFIVEGSSGGNELVKLAQKGSEGEFLFAVQLAKIAETYGFDGWLINFESAYPPGKFSPRELQLFLTELKGAMKERVPGSEVIWYDALTILNQVHWQNGLTLLNAPFFYVTDGIFTNYFWRQFQHFHTSVMARVMSRPADVYTGIDCYGRGSLGDGGFGVGMALKEIHKEGLSTALFAPGWTYENFDGKDFHAVDRKFWIGDEEEKRARGHGAIADYATLRECGTEDFFYTNFNRGFGSSFWLKGKKVCHQPWVHIGSQSILPSFCPKYTSPLQWKNSQTTAYTGGNSIAITILPLSQPSMLYLCPLYKLGAKWSKDLIFQFSIKLPQSDAKGLSFYYELTKPGSTTFHTYELESFTSNPPGEGGWITASTHLPAPEWLVNNNTTITQFGVSYRPPSMPSTTAEILIIGELLLTTLDTESDNQPSFISSVLTQCITPGKIKLTWSVYATHGSEVLREKRKKPGMWSERTKDFAYFLVWRGTVLMGVAYALDYLVREDQVGEGEWRVDGVTWEGNVFSGAIAT
ncbi:hypothetical protein RUND412_006843 [Rhizina undulata]